MVISARGSNLFLWGYLGANGRKTKVEKLWVSTFMSCPSHWQDCNRKDPSYTWSSTVLEANPLKSYYNSTGGQSHIPCLNTCLFPSSEEKIVVLRQLLMTLYAMTSTSNSPAFLSLLFFNFHFPQSYFLLSVISLSPCYRLRSIGVG